MKSTVLKKGIFISALLIILLIFLFGFLRLNGSGTVKMPQPKSLVIIDIDTYGYALPDSKDAGALDCTIRIKVDGKEKKIPGKIKVQGSSTAKWPKKNWTISIFKDRKRTKNRDLKIGDSLASDKWIAKAEWIDPSLLRNGLSYRLWADIVASRTGEPKNETEKALADGPGSSSNKFFKGAMGFPATYPAQVVVNGEHYGLAMLTLGHDSRNFNIDKGNPKHLYMEFDARGGDVDTKTWEKFSGDGIGEWIEGYWPESEEMSSEQKLAIAALGDFINSPLEKFKVNFDRYLDRDNMIDMLLFLEAIFDYDAVAQDIEIFTHNLEKWYMLPWDKDTTFGMDWNMRGIIRDSEKQLLIKYDGEDPEQMPWYKTYICFKDQVEERYASLRDLGVFTKENLESLIDDIWDKIPGEVWTAELKKWEVHDRLPVDQVGKAQILDWFEKRLEMLDEHFGYN